LTRFTSAEELGLDGGKLSLKTLLVGARRVRIVLKAIDLTPIGFKEVACVCREGHCGSWPG
jgi:hypothetical protein